MKTRYKQTDPDTQLILWGLKHRDTSERNRALSESAEPANNFFDYSDTTLANLSNIVTGLMPVLHIGATFLMNALNSIPWISVILTTLNGLFRAVRTLLIKEIDPNKRRAFDMIGAYTKRVWFTSMGIAGVALGLASMFIASLAIPLTIAATAVDTFNNVVKFCESVASRIFAKPEERKNETTRMLLKLESFVISAASLLGTILLFTPFMPIGAGLLIASSAYALMDKYKLNPAKHLMTFIKNKINPPAKAEKVKAKKTPAITETELDADKKAEQAALFEKLYCKKPEQPETKKATPALSTHTHPTHGNAMKLFQEPRKRPDVFAFRASPRIR